MRRPRRELGRFPIPKAYTVDHPATLTTRDAEILLGAPTRTGGIPQLTDEWGDDE